MPQNPDFLVFITRYLNIPEDTDLYLFVEKFRSESTDNDKFFLEIEKIWKLSQSAALFENTHEKQAVKKINLALKNSLPKRLSWFKAIAASIFVLIIGCWIYIQATKVNYITKTTAQNQIDSVKLSDSSTIILAENSVLIYPDKFASDREISLNRGQAFFKIAHDSKHPFKVLIAQSSVAVLGTSFNIKFSDSKIDLGVITGKVFFSPYPNGATSILIAGQALSYDVTKKQYTAKDAQNSDAWLTKELVFVDTPLEEVCKQLTSYYGTEIKLKDNRATKKKLNAKFKDQNLEQVLDVLNETYRIKIQRVNNQINLITP